MTDNNSSSLAGKLSLISILTVSAIAVCFIFYRFFPQIIEQIAAGIFAFFAFLAGLIFRRRRK